MNLISENSILSENSQIIRLSGELDIHSAPDFKDEVLKIINDGYTNIIIDLDELNFLDSRGLGVFIGISRSIKEKNGNFKLICANQPILKIFQRTGLVDVFNLFNTEEEALKK